MKIKEFQHQPVQPDTYEASMALNQLMRIAKCGMKLHNMIDDSAEMESWVAKKIDLAGDYVKKVYNYTEAEKAGLYDDGGMSEIKKMPKGTGTMQGVKEDAGEKIANMAQNMTKDEFMSNADELGLTPKEAAEYYEKMQGGAYAGKFEDAGSLTDQQKKGLDMINKKYGNRVGGNLDSLPMGYIRSRMDTGIFSDGIDDEELETLLKKHGHESVYDAEDADVDFWEKTYNKQNLPITFAMIDDLEKVLGPAFHDEEKLGVAGAYIKSLSESVSEDAGEGHMSKSTLYHTVKYAIQLMDMIKKGDDLEGWVQSKLNKAADYLQGAANYEEYQRLNPYREELDNNLMQKHAEVIQRNIDEILDKETKLDDIDTKPGMMRILAKRVNEVEKEIAKETRKKNEVKEDGHTDVPSAIRNCETIIEDAMQMKQKLETMQGELPSWMTQMIAVAASDLNDARDYLLNPTSESGIMYRAGVKKYGKKGMTAIQSAAGKGASHQEIGKIKDKYLKDAEELEEGLKDWARNTAMAGIIVAGLAGIGSINDAIDRSVPAIAAMETALEMAQDSGNDELAKMIEKDLSDAKIRLNSGKDLSYVKDLQSKYAKFIKTENITYESRLALALNQQLK